MDREAPRLVVKDGTSGTLLDSVLRWFPPGGSRNPPRQALEPYRFGAGALRAVLFW